MNTNRILLFADTHTRSTMPYAQRLIGFGEQVGLLKRLEMRHDLAAFGGHLGIQGRGFVKLLPDLHAARHVLILIRYRSLQEFRYDAEYVL